MFRPRFFFKFYSFGGYTCDTLYHLKKNEIYASSVNKLNDPFENYWEAIEGEQYTSVNQEFRKRVEEKKGVFCMSSSENKFFPLTPDSILLWSHYANSHQGFCIQFSEKILTTKNQVADNDNYIIYCDDVPGRIDSSYGYEADRELHRILHQKHSCWQYEQEARLIFEHANLYYTIPEGCIESIFCGCNISDGHRYMLKKFAQEIGIKFHSLKISNKYGFTEDKLF